MVRAFRSELLKLRRLSMLAGGATMAGLSMLFAFIGIDRIVSNAAAGRPGTEGLTPQTVATANGMVRYLGRSSSLLEVIALIMVAATVAAEYNQGTLRNLLVRRPERLRLLAGKMLATLLYVVLCSSLAMALAFGVAVVEAGHAGISTSAWTTAGGIGQLLVLDGNTLLAVAGFSLMGMFVAVLFRSAAAAVGVSLAYLLAVEGILTSLWNDLAKWLPGAMFDAVATGSPQVSYARALVTAGVYVVLMLAVTAVLFRRRDVTS